jgi:hypothetical protein
MNDSFQEDQNLFDVVFDNTARFIRWSTSNLAGTFIGFITNGDILGLFKQTWSYDPFELCILWPIGLPFGIVVGALTYRLLIRSTFEMLPLFSSHDIALFTSYSISFMSGFISSNITLIVWYLFYG